LLSQNLLGLVRGGNSLWFVPESRAGMPAGRVLLSETHYCTHFRCPSQFCKTALRAVFPADSAPESACLNGDRYKLSLDNFSNRSEMVQLKFGPYRHVSQHAFHG